ncbi:MAG: DMT family transporter, partial [Gemmatimonadota bacterium]
MQSDRLGILAIFASAVGYAFLAILLKWALAAGAAPLPLVAWRFGLGATFVLLLLLARRRPLPPPQAWPPLVGLGAIYAVNALAFTFALQWVPASTAALIFYVYPVVVVLLAALFLGESLTLRRVAAMLLVVAGCGLTAGLGLRGGHPLGVGLVLLSMSSLSLYIVAARPVLANRPAHGSAALIVTTTAVVALGAALAGPGLALGGGSRAAALVAIIALVSTALPITLFAIGLKRVDAGRAAMYSTIEPVITVAAAALLLGERIAAIQYLGGALILAG